MLISLSASHSNATYTISDLSALSKQPSYILFSTLYFVSIALLTFLSFGAVTPSLEPYRGFLLPLPSTLVLPSDCSRAASAETKPTSRVSP